VSLPKKQAKCCDAAMLLPNLAGWGCSLGAQKVKSHHIVMDIAAAVHSPEVAAEGCKRREWPVIPLDVGHSAIRRHV
jgi:hypothetical protein